MFFASDKIKRQSEDFKILITEIQHDEEITQESLGAELGVHQSTIAQWLNPSTDNHLPAFELANLPNSFLLPALKFILRGKLLVVEPLKYMAQINGEISDELLKIMSKIGDMAKNKELTRSHLKLLKKHAADLHELVHQIDLELEAAEFGEHHGGK